MRWEDVREKFPEEWVVFEATDAVSQEGFRYMKDVSIIDRFDDSLEALQRYKELHRSEPSKEIYFLHTSRADI